MRIQIAAISLLLIGCDSLQHPKKHHASSAHGSNYVSAPKAGTLGVGGVLGGNDKGIQVDARWMNHYKELEKKYGSVDGDSHIWQDGNTFWVNDEVSAHFSEMKRAENTPAPMKP